jgi:hypothetical protein
MTKPPFETIVEYAGEVLKRRVTRSFSDVKFDAVDGSPSQTSVYLLVYAR